MCYSKEVQLATGSTILASCFFYYIYFSIKFEAESKKWLLPFLKNALIAYALIGGHQVFEFLSLLTGSQIVYKIGLIISISSMFFLLRSLEILLNRKIKSSLALILILAVAVHSFFIDMSFEEFGVFVRHNSVYFWSFAWMFLFIYFHFCAIFGRQFLKDSKSKQAILAYLMAILDISFLISLLYTAIGYYKYYDNVCGAFPSIWCTFSVVQILILPIFLFFLPRILNVPEEKSVQTMKETLFYVLLSILTLMILVNKIPFFQCLTYKFVFP